MPLMRRALKVLSDREVTPQLGLLKSTLLQLDSTFSERTYGVEQLPRFRGEARHRGLRLAARDRAATSWSSSRKTATITRARAARRTSRALRSRAADVRRRSRGECTGGRGEPPRLADGDPRSAAAVPVGAESAALADVRPPGEAVPPRRRPDVRRAELRLHQPERPAARVPERRAVPDGARSPGGHPVLPGHGHEACRRDADRGRRAGVSDGRRRCRAATAVRAESPSRRSSTATSFAKWMPRRSSTSRSLPRSAPPAYSDGAPRGRRRRTPKAAAAAKPAKEKKPARARAPAEEGAERRRRLSLPFRTAADGPSGRTPGSRRIVEVVHADAEQADRARRRRPCDRAARPRAARCLRRRASAASASGCA